MVSTYQVSTLEENSPQGGSQPYDMNSRANPATTRINADGSSESLGVQKYSPTESLGTSPEHPLGNAKDSYGRSVPFHSLTGESLVTLDGTTATLDQLAQLGYAKKEDGKWDVVNPALVKLGEQQEAEQAERDYYDSLDLHPQVLESHLNTIIEPVPQAVYDNAIAQFAESLDISKLDITGIAQSSGKTDAEVKKGLEFVQSTFTAQVQSALGEDTDAVMQWARISKEGELKEAMRKLLIERKMTGIKDLHKAFQKDCSTEAQENRAVHYLRSQGISVRKDGKQWLVKTDTGDMALQNAFNQGYVKWVGGKAKVGSKGK
jgi:hypothetical protein